MKALLLPLLAFFIPLALPLIGQAGQGDNTLPPNELPAIGSAAPDFTLPDAHTGTKRTLSEFAASRRPVALFFFCGCPACHAVATEWAMLQRGNALPANTATIIVYSTTDRAEARARVAASGLDKRRTAVLCDTEDLSVTEGLYHAEPCPRLFVVDPAGKVVYANTGDDDVTFAGDGDRSKPQEAPAGLLVARALSALQSNVSAKTQEDAAP